ncbi:unnamed protein product, partial [Discosporangium mesarthrocarpum]
MLGRLSRLALKGVCHVRPAGEMEMLSSKTLDPLRPSLPTVVRSTSRLDVRTYDPVSQRAAMSTAPSKVATTGVKGARRGRGWPKGVPSDELASAAVAPSAVDLPSNLKLAQSLRREDEEASPASSDAPGDPEPECTLAQGLTESLVHAKAKDMEVPVVSWEEGGQGGMRALDLEVFGVPIRRDVVHEVIRWQLAKRRAGNAKTKRLSEIRGSGRKVRPQKGTGMARAGHSRPPHWRGGYKPHGPRVRDWSHKLNKKVRKMGLRVALSARLKEGKLTVVDRLTCPTYSTSSVLRALKEKGVVGGLEGHRRVAADKETVTFILGDDQEEPEFIKSTSNVVGFRVLPARDQRVLLLPGVRLYLYLGTRLPWGCSGTTHIEDAGGPYHYPVSVTLPHCCIYTNHSQEGPCCRAPLSERKWVDTRRASEGTVGRARDCSSIKSKATPSITA